MCIPLIYDALNKRKCFSYGVLYNKMSKRPFTVYAWGKNDKGELSKGCHSNILAPTPVKRLGTSSLASVTSGGSHSVALDIDGRLYSSGCYLHNKLGLASCSTSTVPVFTKLPALSSKRITQVACGEYHTLCLSEDGSVCAGSLPM